MGTHGFPRGFNVNVFFTWFVWPGAPRPLFSPPPPPAILCSHAAVPTRRAVRDSDFDSNFNLARRPPAAHVPAPLRLPGLDLPDFSRVTSHYLSCVLSCKEKDRRHNGSAFPSIGLLFLLSDLKEVDGLPFRDPPKPDSHDSPHVASPGGPRGLM